jgi:hypothetical protein
LLLFFSHQKNLCRIFIAFFFTFSLAKRFTLNNGNL